ncbi:hypothetical protein AJ88_45470 [Mesorhizobium amorphae CCBAU 01583]|nr:hypothetical protein AJ88_45470 [Mesorhizobium amorphae CCBAU 01583]
MKNFFPIVAFIAVALISLTMAGFAYFATQEAARIKFAATADDALNRIESRIDLHLSLLRSTQALFDARNGDISRGEFKAFFSALDVDNNFAGLRGIGFLRLAKTGDEAAVERDILRDQGSRMRSIRRRRSHGGRRSCCSNRWTRPTRPASASTCSPNQCGGRRSKRRWPTTSSTQAA